MEKEELEDIYLTRKNIMLTTRVLLYCTKSTPYLIKDDFPLENQPIYYIHYKEDPRCYGLPLNGKIVAECEVETEEIRLSAYSDYEDKIYLFDTPTLTNDELLDKSCLSDNELDNYLINEKGYALHISNLKIFDKPLSIREFDLKTIDRSKETSQNSKDHSFKNTIMHIERKNNKLKSKFEVLKPINKAPQNMCSVFKVDSKNYEKKYYVLISIRPEWLCKILNGEKTIEVRKKVLKEML